MDDEALYEWICRQGDTEAAVAGIDDAQLRALHHYLTLLPDGGVPRLIHALVIAEAAKRFLTS